MGNEESSMVDPSTRPFTLSARSTEALAQYIKEGKAKKIVVLVRPNSLQEGCRMLTFHRLELESQRQLASPTSARQKPVSTPTSSA